MVKELLPLMRAEKYEEGCIVEYNSGHQLTGLKEFL